MKNLWNKIKPLIKGWTIKGMIILLEQQGYEVKKKEDI